MIVDTPVESSVGEVRLRRCLNDLISILALPAAWTGNDASQIVGTLLGALVGMLNLDFAYVRLNAPEDGPSVEFARFGESLEHLVRPRDLGETLTRTWGATPVQWPLSARIVLGGDQLSVGAARLGLHGELGVVVAGSQRSGFPGQTERLLLDVAANQAAIGLQQARLLEEQRRVSRELDRRVAQRTAELASAIDELRRSERESRLIIDTIPALAWSARPGGAAEFFNRHYLDFVGLSAEDASDWGWTAAVHPDDLVELTATWHHIMDSAAPGEAEARLRRHDGEYRWFLIRVNPLRDESGAIVQWYGVNTDIEDRKRAEAELRRVHNSFADAQRLSKTGSFITDLVADDHKWSEETFRIFEFDPATKISVKSIREVIHPDDLPSFDAVIARAMTGVDVTFGFRIVTAAGALKHVRGIAHVVEQVAGRPMFVGALQDVTAGTVAEEALNRARAELAHVARVTSMSTLTAAIAHEVNQPLSGIVTNASTCLRMLDGNPPDVSGARETARRTIRDGHRASEVITRLRALFGKKDLTLESLDLNEATREVIALSTGELQRNRVILLSEFARDLPSITGDRVQLQQVILNLIRNASDAMAGVDDRLRQLLIRTQPEDGDRVRVIVRDSGAGIESQSVDKLFEAFYTTKPGGMGIGLSISRSIVERHHGRIWAEPNDGPGATFSFSVPRGPASSGEAAARVVRES